MFTCKERVIRDGYLVAFEGEQMSDDEARDRGLIAAEAKPKRKRPAKAKAAEEGAKPEETPEAAEEGA